MTKRNFGHRPTLADLYRSEPRITRLELLLWTLTFIMACAPVLALISLWIDQ
jgi:hypothetical protein